MLDQQKIYLEIRVIPGAQKTAFVGMLGERLKFTVVAAPENNAANKALMAYFCAALKLPRQAVCVVRGAASRDKLLCIMTKLSVADIQAKIRE